jgi:hypothetical protein
VEDDAGPCRSKGDGSYAGLSVTGGRGVQWARAFNFEAVSFGALMCCTLRSPLVSLLLARNALLGRVGCVGFEVAVLKCSLVCMNSNPPRPAFP